MNKAAKKITGVLLAGALGTASLAGCGSTQVDGTQPLLTSGEDTVTVGTGSLMLRMNQATMLSYYSMMGGSTSGIWSQDAGDGETYGDTTKANVLDELENMLVQKQHAAEYDVTISEEEQSQIQEAAQAFMEANTDTAIQSLAVSQSDVEDLLELYTYQTKMYDPMVADVDTNVDDSEAAQSRITYCRIDISDTQNDDGTTTPLTDEEKQAKKDQAQAILDQLQASGDPAGADMDAIAKGVSEDLSAVDNTFGDDDTLLDDKLKEAAKTLQDGQIYGEVVEGENAYFVVRMDSVLDREATDQEKESIVNERQQQAYSDLLDQWKEDTDITVNEDQWAKITLTDTEQYTFKQPETEESAEDSTDTAADAAESTEGDAEASEDTSGETADSTEAQEDTSEAAGTDTSAEGSQDSAAEDQAE